MSDKENWITGHPLEWLWVGDLECSYCGHKVEVAGRFPWEDWECPSCKDPITVFMNRQEQFEMEEDDIRYMQLQGMSVRLPRKPLKKVDEDQEDESN